MAILYAFGITQLRGREGWTLHPSCMARFESIAYLLSTRRWISQVGTLECEDLKWGSSSFSLVLKGLDCDPGEQ